MHIVRWIEAICITYNNVDIKPSVFLSLLFRLLGVYVYERLIGCDQNDDTYEFFTEIHLLSKNYCPKEEEERTIKDTEIFVILDDSVQLPTWLKRIEGFQLIKYETDEKLLKALAKSLLGIYQRKISEDKAEYEAEYEAWGKLFSDFETVGEWFLEFGMMEASLIGKSFYPHAKLFEDSKKSYLSFIEKLQVRVDWKSGADSGFLKLALLNSVYELNFICKRNSKDIIYSAEELIELCDVLITEGGKNPNLWLLQGQIYDQLLDDYKKAFYLYEKCIAAMPTIHAYAQYLAGYIYEKKEMKYTEALEHYQKALSIYPHYYRVQYRIAMCQKENGNMKATVDAFLAIYDILNNKYSACVMRPMEIEYWYKISCRLGDLADDVFKNFRDASTYYKMAVKGWDMIDKSHFCKDLLEDKRCCELKSIMEKNFNSNRLYEKNLLYARSIGDYSSAEVFKEKMQRGTI